MFRVLISAAILAVIPASGLQAADVPGVAQSACLEAVNNQYGGSVKTVDVASTEFSQANSVVMVRATGIRGSKQSETWKCLVSNRGVVQDLSIMPGTSSVTPTKPPASSAAQAACMEAINRNYGGNVRELKVVSSSWLKPKFEVIVKAIGVRGGSSNERWRCLGTGTSSITDLSVIQR